MSTILSNTVSDTISDTVLRNNTLITAMLPYDLQGATIEAQFSYLLDHTDCDWSEVMQYVGIKTDALINLDMLFIDWSLRDLMEHRHCQKEGYLPLFQNDHSLGVLLISPFRQSHIRTLFPLRKSVYFFYIKEAAFHFIFDYLCHDQTTTSFLLYESLYMAIKKQASDLHINQLRDGTKLSCRVDGVLTPLTSYSEESRQRLVTMIKLMAGLDISAVSKMQDGAFEYKIQGKVYQLRISTIPTRYGEDLTCRIIDSGNRFITFKDLGFDEIRARLLKQFSKLQHGLILITGATGSGKTTTLYSILSYIQERAGRNIMTLEDPIERDLPGIRQTQINRVAGINFAQGLKTILRHDPDVIMLGEIRDKETARIALEAAYTGHLVLGTLHTSTCEGAVKRLQGLGVDSFLLEYCLKGVICQRLIAKPCSNCNSLGCSQCLEQGVLGRELETELIEWLEPLSGGTEKDMVKWGKYYPFSKAENREEC